MRRVLPPTALCIALLAPALAFAEGNDARAEMKDREGKPIGTVTLTATPHGVVMKGALSQLPPGPHGFHVHAIGKCEPPFTSAGGHWNPGGHKHGFEAQAGPHEGDLPNLHVAGDGTVVVDAFAGGATLTGGSNSMLDQDGAALVIHAKADDYRTDPAGDSGDRIVCGVIGKGR